MHKRAVLRSLVLVVVLGLVFGLCVSFCFAQETFTITTYYPSPYGVYNELQSNKLAVGDTDGDGGLDAGDQPPANGQLYTARSVIFKPQSSLPASDDRREGELVYNNSDDSLYLYNGSSWVKQGGGGGCYVSYSGGCLTGFTNKGSAGRWGSCYAPPGYASPDSHFRPPGGGCLSTWGSTNIGEAFVCCK